MDREARRAAFYGVAKSRTWLSDWTELNSFCVQRLESQRRWGVNPAQGQEKMKWNDLAQTVHSMSLQSCLALCYPKDCSLPVSMVHGILQARMLKWVALSFSRDLPDPGIEPGSPGSSVYAGGFLTTSANWESLKSKVVKRGEFLFLLFLSFSFFCLGLQQIGCCPFTLGKAVYFIESNRCKFQSHPETSQGNTSKNV